MKPKLRFPGFTDDWEQRKLGEIGQCQSGVGFPDAEQGGTTGIPFFKVSDMNNPGNETEMVNANNYVTEEQIARKKWKPITEVPAMFFAKVGAAVLLNRKRLVSFPFLLDNNTMAYKFSSKWDARFGKAVFETIYLPGLAQTGALPSYNARDVENISIFIPATKEEQVRIGGFFKTIDDTITLHQRKCDSLVKLKKALLQKMFPKNWEQRKLGDIGNTFTGLTGKTKVDFGHGEAKFITYLNIFNNAIADPEQLESVEIDPKQNEVKYGDIFFTTSSETPEEVGMSSIWLQNQANVYLNSFCFGYRPQIAIDPYFMAFNLRSESVRKKFIFLAQGISRYNISKNKVMEMEINLPCLSEQKKIGEFFFKLDNLITLHQRKVQALQKLKKALLQQMFV